MNKSLFDTGMPEFVRMYLLHAVSRVLCYWLPNYILFRLNRQGLGRQWKIQGARKPPGKLAWEVVWNNFKGDFLPQLLVSFLAQKLLTARPKRLAISASGVGAEAPEGNAKKEERVVVQSETPGQGRGWACLRACGSAPKAWTHIWQVAVAYLGYDFMFYWSHRLMHHPKLYKHCHKIHHQFHTPIGPSASHAHPVEDMVQLMAWYLPIGFAGWLNKGEGGLHTSTLFYYNCFRWLETVDAHCGYEFPFSPFHLLPICGGARRHDYHHRAFTGNYGATIFWDRLCGTDSGFWQEVAEEGGMLLGGLRVPK